MKQSHIVPAKREKGGENEINAPLPNTTPTKTRPPSSTWPTCIILAAGRKTRMVSYGSRSLLQIDAEGTPLLAFQLAQIRKYLKRVHTIVVLGHESERILKKVDLSRVTTIINERFEETGPVHSLKLAMMAMVGNGPIYILHGDVMFNGSVLRTLERQKRSLTIINEGCRDKKQVGIIEQNGIISHFNYKAKAKWGELVKLYREELGLARDFVERSEHAKMTTLEMLNHILQHNGTIMAVPMSSHAFLFEIDSFGDYTKMLAEMKDASP